MTMGCGSGVFGSVGRYPLPERTGPGGGDLVLAGARLPLAGVLRSYACGITPYDVTHLGHAATFVWVDLLSSLARAVGARPVVCRNVTDIDDVLTAAADRGQIPYDELASTQEFLFDRDMTALAVARPQHTPHARHHVRQVIDLTDALLHLDRAYERAGTVFFRSIGDADHGGLSEEQARLRFAEFGDAADDGRDRLWDVPLWRPSSAEHPAWPSPWGWGRPAWHVECAAMTLCELGAGVDVLAGGADLAFPHHAYQAAIVEALTGGRFARARLHVGTVHHQGTKMAKQTGNLVLVRDLLEQVPAPVIRMLLLNRPWSAAWEYDDRELSAAAGAVDRLRAAAERPGEGRAEMLTALLNDLDVPAALAVAEDTGGAGARLLREILKV